MKLVSIKLRTRPPREPKCPGCGSRVNRPKCFFELGGDCPRHPLLAEYREAVRAAKERTGITFLTALK